MYLLNEWLIRLPGVDIRGVCLLIKAIYSLPTLFAEMTNVISAKVQHPPLAFARMTYVVSAKVVVSYNNMSFSLQNLEKTGGAE